LNYTLPHIAQAAQYILQQIGDAKVICFEASMGSGKTTLINEICKQLSVIDATSSPTFSIINQYKTKQETTIYHLDLYRLKDEEELMQIGVEDVLYSNDYCFVEWPQLAKNIMPDNAMLAKIAIISEEERQVEVTLFNP
jgi:tRNA threonylcarbamoyladenosine biosynthesis protein TsaE